MNINCEVVKDLLPLYADDLETPVTRENVEMHLKTCESCRKELAFLKAAKKAPEDLEKTMKRTTRYRVVLPVLAALLLVLTLISGFFLYSTVPVWLSYEEAIVNVTQKEVGTVLEVTDQAKNIFYTLSLPWSENKVTGISFWGYRNDLFYPLRDKNKILLTGKAESLWYRSGAEDQEHVLLWGDGEIALDPVIQELRENNEDIMQDRSLLYVFHITLWLGVIGILVGILLRKKKCGKVICYVALALLCFAASCLFITNGRMLCTMLPTSEMSVPYRFPPILIMALLSFGTVVTMIESYIVLMGYRKKI